MTHSKPTLRLIRQSTALAALVLSGMNASPAAEAQEPVDPAAAAARDADTTGRSKTQLEMIVVTATRTGETNIQDTPIAISAFSADRLEQSGATNVQSLVALTPSLQIAENAHYPQIYIRGVGTNIILGNADPSTTVHLDGVVHGAAVRDLFPVPRYRACRGAARASGVLFGRNSAGGTINVITRDPSNEFQGKALITLGNENSRQVSAVISGPLAGSLLGSLAGIYSKRDGLIEKYRCRE
ncbi:MAG: TonB-dependent receptor plug domain-containing protein [Proteobacteria bacterium]|nr:TonB-dependent receptor plug domain-containing protein [Pseudomonadota bacterium]